MAGASYYGFGGVGTAAVGAGVNAVMGYFNNKWAKEREQLARAENYRYGEMAADEADARTRALYNDLYSPQALADQYKEAGLSPGLMFGGTPGQGGMSGAQGTGAAGLPSTYMPISLLEGVQAANILAQTEKIKAETKNINKDTDLKLLEQQYNSWRNQEKNIQYSLTNLWVSDVASGEKTSFYEIANNSNSYEEYIEKCRAALKKGDMTHELMLTGTEEGQKTMREIWMTSNRYETEIATLSEEGVSAKFQQNVLNCLEKEGFIKQNAETVLSQLKAAAADADLTEKQKDAWNRVLERMQKRNSTAADYAIVAAMILNQAASHWSGMGVTLVKDKK